MGSPATTASEENLDRSDPCNHRCGEDSSEDGADPHINGLPPLPTIASCVTTRPHPEPRFTIETTNATRSARKSPDQISLMSLSDFVRRRFIPEFVEVKRSAGRSHFREILKYILLAETAHCGLAETYDRIDVKRRAVQSWPYMDSLRLCDIDEGSVRQIVSVALASGYSLQTATHIRNVIRAIYSHAIVGCCYTGKNPAALVRMPAMARKDRHTLSTQQLRRILEVMRFPERAIALLSILTEMNLVEISGLQWKFVNLSNNRIFVDEEWIPARTIAVRKQWYRGEFSPVMGKRRRIVPVPELLGSILRGLRSSKQLTLPEHFVVASRTGRPIYPGNIAKRRLKSIGQLCEVPWLSWRVFHHTHVRLRTEFGRNYCKELESILPLQWW